VTQHQYKTGPWRIALAVVVGAAFAAVVGDCVVLLDMYIGTGAVPFDPLTVLRSENSRLTFVHWLVGLLVTGGPVWALLHARGSRNWPEAAIAGAALTFVVSLAYLVWYGFAVAPPTEILGDPSAPVAPYWRTATYWTDALQSLLELTAFGAVVGLVVWRVAYRRVSGGAPDAKPY
jgi:hypothetical protein